LIGQRRCGSIVVLMEVNVADHVQKSPGQAAVKEIVFDCPHCGKSLAIDARGAGLMIKCPECQQDVQVPGVPLAERPVDAGQPVAQPVNPAALSEALSASHAKIERLVASLEEVRERRRYLEKVRSDNMARFELISKDLVTIQNAMDRIVAILQDAAAERQVGDS
jgi:predicted RNA-binding Zn-ribbon protein involved in translation (DUF1610 family)